MPPQGTYPVRLGKRAAMFVFIGVIAQFVAIPPSALMQFAQFSGLIEKLAIAVEGGPRR